MAMFEPLMDKAAAQLGVDRVQIRKINAPVDNSPWGFPEKKGQPQDTVTSAKVREVLDSGAELFKWDERKKRSGQRSGTKVRGVSVAMGAFFSGSNGFDGLLVIKPDGKLYVHQGIGNLGTHSVSDTARVAAEALGMPWDQVVVVWGSTAKSVPWSSTQDGSQTTHAHSRANHAAALTPRLSFRRSPLRNSVAIPSSMKWATGGSIPVGIPAAA